MQTRRNFIRNSAAALAATTVAAPLEAIAAERSRHTISPNEKMRVGLIGCKGMGWTDLTAQLKQPDIECVALADVDQNVLDERAADAEKMQGSRPKLFKDYRKLLEMKDLDAVIIATPDHWHCLAFCDALSAGKHVYVEKPIANSIEECNVMLRAAQKHPKQIVQVGQWQRSGTHYADAIDYVRSGKLGQIRLVKVWAYQGWMKSIDPKPDGPVPDGVDYDMWLGPAPKRPFNPNRFHFNFRWYWDYAGGLMTDWGVHEIDIALFAMNAVAPKSVMASGGKTGYPNDAAETPDTLQAVFEYDGFNMLWEHATGIDAGPFGRTEGIAFIGNDSTLVLNRGSWMLNPELSKGSDGIFRYKTERLPEQYKPNNVDYVELHHQNFVDCIRDNSPEKLKCGIETGAIAAINAQMGNIAFKTGRKVYWDAATGTFKNDSEANRLIASNYQNGWKLPRS